MSELLVTDVASLGVALTKIAKRLNASMTSLAGGGGSSLVSLATGNRVSSDISLGPVIRFFDRIDYEFVVRPQDKLGPVVERPQSHRLRVVSEDGGPIEIGINEIADVVTMMHTVAMARDRTVTGLCRESGLNSTGLVAFVTGSSGNKDVRLNGILRVLKSAEFDLYVRPRHRNRRQARLHAEVKRLLPG